MSSSKEDPPAATNIKNWKVGDQVWVRTGSSASDSNYEELATITKLPTIAAITTTKTMMKKKRGGAKKKKSNDDDEEEDDDDKLRLNVEWPRGGHLALFCCMCAFVVVPSYDMSYYYSYGTN